LENVVGSVHKGVSTRRQLSNFSSHHDFVSCVEPKKVYEALEDLDWLNAMHDELNNFERNKVWTLVERTKYCRNVMGPSGSSRTSKMQMALSFETRKDWWLKVSPKSRVLILVQLSLPLLVLNLFASYLLMHRIIISNFNKWMLKVHFLMVL
jgi:hypothetical protein